MVDLLPEKEWFYPDELVRIFKGFRGFSKSSIYRKIEKEEIKAEIFSDRGTRIRRVAIIEYFENVRKRGE